MHLRPGLDGFVLLNIIFNIQKPLVVYHRVQVDAILSVNWFTGGTFAVYSLLAQHVNLEKSTGKQFTRLASDSKLKFFSKQNGGKVINSKTKELLDNSATAQRILLIVVMTGTCMVIGDGALTPAISGLPINISQKVLSCQTCISLAPQLNAPSYMLILF